MKTTTFGGVGLWIAVLALGCSGDDTGSNDQPATTPTTVDTTTSMPTGTNPGAPPPVTPGVGGQTPAPGTPSQPATPTPGATGQEVTPSPTQPGPADTTPLPVNPGEPAPVPNQMEPVDPGPMGTEDPTPGSTEPGPTEPGPTEPGPMEPGPTEPAPEPEPEPEPGLITSGQGAWWQVQELQEGTGGTTITVNEGQTHQDWIGFGGTFNEKGWDALAVLSEEDRQRAIELLFSKTNGAAFTMARIPIGSSDYGMDRYSLAPSKPVSQSFSIDRDREMLIPYIKAALEVNPDIWFWASPWSPPPWMKSNNAFDRGSMKSEEFPEHAEYLARFVEAYAEEGIIVRAVHPQNEPGYEQDYPSCAWNSSQYTTYIADHLGPLFAERLPDTEIWVGTMSNSSVGPGIVNAVMNNATARSYVSGIGMQWGMSGSVSGYVQHGVHLMQTEHICGNFPWEAGTDQSRAPNDHAYGVESWGYFKDWIGNGVNSYLAWNMVLDTIGRSIDTQRAWAQNALLVVDRNSSQLIPTPYYYAFRHISQYTEPGATRIGTQGGDALAFKNPDGSIVVALYSQGGGQTTVSVGGKSYAFDVPQGGWATVNWQPE